MIKVTCANIAKNGLEVVLMEASYNNACYWIETEARKHGIKVTSAKHDYKTGFDIIETETRTFYYCEVDGILYGE